MPFRWMTGTQSHEGMLGTMAAIEHIAWIGRECSGEVGLSRRDALVKAFEAIEAHESELCLRMLEGLGGIGGVNIWGITEPERIIEGTNSILHSSEDGSLGDMSGIGRKGHFRLGGKFLRTRVNRST